jgi:hypothetical protein
MSVCDQSEPKAIRIIGLAHVRYPDLNDDGVEYLKVVLALSEATRETSETLFEDPDLQVACGCRRLSWQEHQLKRGCSCPPLNIAVNSKGEVQLIFVSTSSAFEPTPQTSSLIGNLSADSPNWPLASSQLDQL